MERRNGNSNNNHYLVVQVVLELLVSRLVRVLLGLLWLPRNRDAHMVLCLVKRLSNLRDRHADRVIQEDRMVPVGTSGCNTNGFQMSSLCKRQRVLPSSIGR